MKYLSLVALFLAFSAVATTSQAKGNDCSDCRTAYEREIKACKDGDKACTDNVVKKFENCKKHCTTRPPVKNPKK